MGIAYRDLKNGRYYKGTLDDGSKVYLFVESVTPVGSLVGVSACRFTRKTAGGQWLGFGANMNPGDDSRMRREVTLSEVTSEGIPRAPLDKGTPPPKPVTTGSGTKAASTPSASPVKPLALRKDGSPKAAIPDNKNSPACLHCRKPTRTMTLLQWSVQWCPECEP